MSVGFLHTSPVHVPTFQALVRELAPGTAVVSAASEALLDLAREIGPNHPDVRRAVARMIEGLVGQGAETVVCTCSTIGGVAEEIGAELGHRVLRVDRPMAERAIAIGDRVVVAAALESTVAPTRELLEAVAGERDRSIEIDVRVIAGAWERFEAGDAEGYVEAIAAELPALAECGDVIVLAQASMAPAAATVDVAVPVLSSPRLAVEAICAR